MLSQWKLCLGKGTVRNGGSTSEDWPQILLLGLHCAYLLHFRSCYLTGSCVLENKFAFCFRPGNLPLYWLVSELQVSVISSLLCFILLVLRAIS